jgi:phage shock protein PspC (stress-responsive transcriptional regulator)
VGRTLAATEEEVRRRRTWRAVKLFALLAGVFTFGMAALFAAVGDAMPRWLIFAAAGIAAAAAISLPIVVLLLLVRGGDGRIFQRLGPGSILLGVCRGLAEATSVDVRLIRLAFFALLFADGIGLTLYVLLALAMPVHPDDRQYLLRFRLRRWWQRKFAHAEHHAR